MRLGDTNQKKEILITRSVFALSTLILGLLFSTGGESAEIVTSAAVKSYVNVRAAPSTSSEIIGALRPGKSAPMVSESEEWFAIRMSGGVTGFVSRYWTDYASEADSAGPRIYSVDTAEVTAPVETTQAQSRDRSVLATASAMHRQGNPHEAYRLLSRLESEWAGDAGFDYLHGVAALDSGRPGEAIFSLERVIRSLPGFVGARLDLARALYEVGDRDRAREEFETLLEADPPEDVRTVIAAYMAELEEPLPDQAQKNVRLYATAAGGYDSNANGAADINDFLGFTLDSRSTETETPFIQAQLGAMVRQPLSSGVTLFWRGNARSRHNPDADFVDQMLFNTTAALGFSAGVNDFMTGVAAYWSALDSDFSERSVALDLGWSRPINDNVMRVTLRAGPVEFQQAQKIRDIDRVLYTLGMRYPIQEGSGSWGWTLIGGRDRAEDRQSAYSNTRYGGRFGANWKTAAGMLMFDVGALKIPYNGNSNFFGSDRDDEQITTTLSLEIKDKPLQGWNFVPNLRYVKNSSTIAIFDYDRLEIGVAFTVAR